MANNDDMEFDDKFLFDDEDFDGSGPDVKEGKVSRARQAGRTSKSILKGVGKGLFAGLKSGLEDSFPNTSDLVKEVVSIKDDIVTLKDELTTEMTPTLKTISTIGARVLPKAESFIPKKIYEKAFGFLKEHGNDEDAISDSKRLDNERNEIISSAISDAFANKMEQDGALALDDRKEHQVDRLIDASRFKAMSGAISSIDAKLETIASTVTGPAMNYFKASLELKYKHLFVTKDIFDTLKTSSNSTLKVLEEIKHNVGLPDSIKQDELKARQSKLKEYLGDRIGHLRASFFKNLKSSILNTFEQITAVVPLLDMATSMMDMMGDGKKLTKTDIAATVTKHVTQFLTNATIQEHFSAGNAKNFKDLVENRTENGVKRASLRLMRMGKSARSESGIKGFLGDTLTEGMSNNNNTYMGNALFDNADKSTEFDNLTKTAIISVIPRHLEHISAHVERLSEKLAGDMPLIERIVDPSSGRLLDSNTVFKNLMTEAKKATGYSETARGETIERFKYGSALTQGLKRPSKELKEEFERYKEDLNKFISNVALSLDGEWNPKEIREYSTSGITTDYILKAFEGIDRPQAVASFIARSVYDKNGKLNITVSDEIDKAITNELDNMNPAKLADFLTKHNARHLAIDKKAYDVETGRMTPGAIHAIYKPKYNAPDDYTKTVGGENQGIINDEDSIDDQQVAALRRKRLDYAVSLRRLKNLKRRPDLSPDERIEKFALEKALSDDVGEMFGEQFNKVTNFVNSIVGKVTGNVKEVGKELAGSGIIRESADKATLTKIKRITRVSSTLIFSIPEKTKSGHKAREISVDIKHSPCSTEEIPKNEIAIAMRSTDKKNPVFKALHSKNPRENYFPVEFNLDTVELLTKKDTVGDRGYVPYDLDNPGGSPSLPAAPRPKPIIPSPTDGEPGIEPTPPSTIAPINTGAIPELYLEKLFESLADKLKPTSPVDVSKLDSIDTTTKEILAAIVKPTSPGVPNTAPVMASGDFTEFHSHFLEFSSLHISLMRELIAATGWPTLRKTKEAIGKFLKGAKKYTVDTVKYGAKTLGKWTKTVAVGAGKLVAQIPEVLHKGAVLAGEAMPLVKAGAKAAWGAAKSGYKRVAAGAGAIKDVVKEKYPGVKAFLSKHTKNLFNTAVNNPDMLLGGLIGGLTGGIPGAMIGAGGAAVVSKLGSSALSGFKKMFVKYVDVYEKGKPIVPGKPLLSAAKQKEGVYFADGKRLKNSRSITAPVFGAKDGMVDSTVALVTQEQIDAGLVDINGKLLTKKKGEKEEEGEERLSTRTGSTILDSLGYIYKGIMGLVFGATKKVGKGAATILGRLFGIEGSDIKEYHKSSLEYLRIIAEVVSQSRYLAVRKIEGDADNDGDRDGSREDQEGKEKNLSITASEDGTGSPDYPEPGVPGVKIKPGNGILNTIMGNGITNAMAKLLPTILPMILPALSAAALPAAIIAGGAVASYGAYKGSKAAMNVIDDDDAIRKRLGLDKNEKITLKHRLAVANEANTGATKLKYINPVYYLSKHVVNKMADKGVPLSEAQIQDFRDRIQEAINEGDKGASDILENFNRAVKNKNWTYAREVSGITDKTGAVIKSDIDKTKRGFSTSLNRHAVEDDSKLGQRFTLIRDEIDESIKNTGILSFKRAAGLKRLRDTLMSLSVAEVTEETLNKISAKLKELDSEADASDDALAKKLALEKEKQDLIDRQERLLDSISISKQKFDKTGDYSRSARMATLKTRVMSVTLDELTSDILDSYDKELKKIDKKALASSQSYMDKEEGEKRDTKLATLLKKIDTWLKGRAPGSRGYNSMVRLQKEASKSGAEVTDEYVDNLIKQFNGIESQVIKYSWTDEGRAEAEAIRKGTFVDKTDGTAPDKSEEAAISFDDQGNVIDKSTGTETSVTLNSIKDGSIVHTHPNDKGLSSADIEAAIYGKLRNISAISPYGDVQMFDTESKEIKNINGTKPVPAPTVPVVNTDNIELGLDNIHMVESTQVNQLNVVIQKLDQLISAILESKEVVNKNIVDASIASINTASSITTAAIKKATTPASKPKTMRQSELNIFKPTLA